MRELEYLRGKKERYVLQYRQGVVFRFFKEIHFFGAVGVPFFLDWLQVSYTQIFLLQAWFSGWLFVLEVPTGVVADKYGRKVSLLLGLLSMFVTWLLFGSVKNYTLAEPAPPIVGTSGVAPNSP